MATNRSPVSNANVQLMGDFEPEWGTPKSPVEGKIFAFNDEGFNPGQNLEANEELDGTRRPKPRVPGNRENKWSLVHYANLDTLPWFWIWALGKRTNSGSADPWTEVATREDNSCSLQSAVIQKRLPFCDGSTPHYGLYKGCRVNTASIDIKATGYYTMNLEGFFKTLDETPVVTMDASPLDWVPKVKIHHGMLLKPAIEIDGVATTDYARFGDLKIQISNKLGTNDRGVGDAGEYSSLVGGIQEVSFSGSLRIVQASDFMAILDNPSTPHSVSLLWDFDGTHTHKIELGTLQFPRSRPMAKGQGILNCQFQSFGYEDSTATIPAAIRVTTLTDASGTGRYD